MPTPPELLAHKLIGTPLGELRLACTPQGLCGAWFVQEQRHAPPEALFTPEQAAPEHPLLREAARQLQAYFDGRLQRFELTLDLSAGTDFQRAVWQRLCDIGHGQLAR